MQRARVLAVDGPEIAPWNELVSQLRRELGERGVVAHIVDARDGMASWETIRVLTSSTELAEDPDFETLAAASLEDLFGRPVQAERDTDAVTVIFGPGAALSRHDELWYFDQPKRYAEAAVGAGAGPQPRPAGHAGHSDDATAVLRRLAHPGPASRHHCSNGVALDRCPDRPSAYRTGGCDVGGHCCGLGSSTVSHPPHVQHHCVGRSLGAAATGYGYRPAEQRSGLRTDRPGERRSHRQPGRAHRRSPIPASGVVAPAGAARRIGARTVRDIIPDPIRLPGHRRWRQPVGALPPAGPVHARGLRLAVYPARELLRWKSSPAPPATTCTTTGCSCKPSNPNSPRNRPRSSTYSAFPPPTTPTPDPGNPADIAAEKCGTSA